MDDKTQNGASSELLSFSSSNHLSSVMDLHSLRLKKKSAFGKKKRPHSEAWKMALLVGEKRKRRYVLLDINFMETATYFATIRAVRPE